MNRSRGWGRAAGPHLAVNYLPVKFTADSFPAGLLGYESADQLARLRTELSETHAVVRIGDEIACVPLAAEAPDVGRQATLDVQENLKLAMRLAQASLIRTLIGWNHKLRRPLLRSCRAPLVEICSRRPRRVTNVSWRGCMSTRSTALMRA